MARQQSFDDICAGFDACNVVESASMDVYDAIDPEPTARAALTVLRPQYGVWEQQSDRDRQQAVAAFLEKIWECKTYAMPRFAHVDYAISKERNKRIKAFVEVKCRNVPRGRYDSYMIALAKTMEMERLSEKTKGVPVLLVVQWTDAIGSVNIGRVMNELTKDDFYMGGRYDTPDDEEPVIYIPMDRFKLL